MRAIAFAILFFAAGNAFADTALHEAKTRFHAGEVAYKLGHFEDALREFSRAYEAKPLPAFLFNIGQCQHELKNYERAIFFYEGYLRELPDAPNAKVTEELLSDTRKQLHAQEEAKRAAEEAEAPRVVTPASAPASVPLPMPMPVAEQKAPVYKRGWFWGTMAGVVVAGVGASLAVYFFDTKKVQPSGTLGTLNRQ